jgi:DNA-binding Lrp family transcriptional regulator
VDALDHQLIGLLRVDARLSTVELAKTLGVSRGTIVNRLARLEKEGTIIGYTVCVKPDADATAVVAWVSIAVEGDGTREVVKALLSEPAVRSLHDTNGRWDLVAEVEAATIDQLSQLLERVRNIKGVENSETSIHLRSFKSRSGGVGTDSRIKPA